MEQLQHFSHEHVLSLVQLQPLQKNENSNTEDEDEEKDEDIDDFVVEECHVGECKMCKEEIYPFHLYYYSCKDCDYSVHKFCAQLPLTQQNHPLHPGHKLTLSDGYQFQDPDLNFDAIFDSFVQCHTCQIERKRFYNYHCSICNFNMDIICATIAEQKMDHPSHPHQLQRYLGQMIFSCNACGLGKTYKNFKDNDHPNLIRCPFPNESFNLLRHLFINKGELTIERKIDDVMFSHQHPLILIDTLHDGSVSLHHPMKRVELLCDACVRPITDVPFYKCSEDDCGFVLHEWCTRLPSKIQDHYGHPDHTLVLQPQFGCSFGVF
ncbi:uncharacterized protein LOC143560439 [Bidens hawaiensis]|uniref:uncharacterized protein LOC143560439 n=1 Tax=Bidens hawaiensis TaxID=980011 RepID=UPI004048F3C2